MRTEFKLGPLPEPAYRDRFYAGHGNEGVEEYFTANQMREYARQQVHLIDQGLLETLRDRMEGETTALHNALVVLARCTPQPADAEGAGPTT